MSRKKTESVGILGGGMQGCCMALLFKKSGFRVTIIDQAASLISRASSNQEGKIHMGFIYAKDPSCKTGFKLLNDGLHFDTCLEELLEKTIPWDGLKSKKFIYLVPRDSLCSVDPVSYTHLPSPSNIFPSPPNILPSSLLPVVPP